MNGFVTRDGNGRVRTSVYIQGGTVGKNGRPLDIGMDIFNRGLCLPSDNKMTAEQQDIVIEIIRKCFQQIALLDRGNEMRKSKMESHKKRHV